MAEKLTDVFPNGLLYTRLGSRMVVMDGDRPVRDHVWYNPDERAGTSVPVGYPRCIYCGADYSQKDRRCTGDQREARDAETAPR